HRQGAAPGSRGARAGRRRPQEPRPDRRLRGERRELRAQPEPGRQAGRVQAVAQARLRRTTLVALAAVALVIGLPRLVHAVSGSCTILGMTNIDPGLRARRDRPRPRDAERQPDARGQHRLEARAARHPAQPQGAGARAGGADHHGDDHGDGGSGRCDPGDRGKGHGRQARLLMRSTPHWWLGLLLALFASPGPARGDDARTPTYFPLQAGNWWSYQELDDEGRPLSRETWTVLDTTPGDGAGEFH